MEDFESKKGNQELDLTPEAEFELEKDIQVNLIKAENVLEAREQMEKLVSLERNSNNGRAIPKIEDCMAVLNLKCTGANIGNEIATSLAEDLYPELYRNVALNKEKLDSENLNKMATSLKLFGIEIQEGEMKEFEIYDGINPENKEMIRDAFIKLIILHWEKS